MTVRLPDPHNSRAVLIGTSSYDNPDFKPLLAVRNNLEVLQELLTSDNGGFLPHRCDVVQDFSEPREVCRRIREAAREAPDTLLVYFAGHGFLGYDGELHLGLTGTDEGDLLYTSVPITEIQRIFETSAGRNKILILDCCHSGSVLDAMMSAPNSDPAPLDIRGTYVLVSSPAALASYAPPEDRYTGFTGELIQLLRDGLAGGPDPLPLSALFDPLTAALKARSLPCPRQQASDGYAALALVRNRAMAGSPGGKAVGPRQAVRRRDADEPSEIRLIHTDWYRKLCQWGGMPIMLGLAWAGLRFAPDGQEELDPTSLAGIITIGALAGMLLVPGTISRCRPSDYSLTISPDGIEVRYAKEHFYYPWHRVSRVWIEARPSGRLRRTHHVLLLRPKPGDYTVKGRFGAPGPQRDFTTGALRFATLRHLVASPAAVDEALARYAGSAWTPAVGVPGRPHPPMESGEVFRTNRLLLTCAAAAAIFIGYVFFPASALARPSQLLIVIGPVVLCIASCAVLWFCVSRIIRPVRLVISAAGLSLTRGDLDITYAWSEIQRIGMLTWPGVPVLSLVVMEPVPRVGHTPPDRTSRFFPELAAGCVTLCSLPEVTITPRGLQEAFQRFTTGAQAEFTPWGHDWLRATPAAAPGTGGRTYTGLRTGWTALFLGITAEVTGLALAALADTADLPELPNALLKIVLMQLALPVLLIYFLTGRHRLTFHVGTTGLTLTLFGLRPHRLHVPWSDIDSIGIVVRQHPTLRHSLVLWPRPGARPQRSIWWPRPHEYGALRLISIEPSRLNTTPQQLDRVIAHHAGHRHTRMQRLPHPDQDPKPAT